MDEPDEPTIAPASLLDLADGLERAAGLLRTAAAAGPMPIAALSDLLGGLVVLDAETDRAARS